MRTTFLAILLFICLPVRAETITVGVASNFVIPMADLVAAFEQESTHEVQLSAASTGVLYAAVSNGARYAAVLAADEERPRRLEEAGLGVAGTRFTYAIGRLELWSVDPRLAGEDCRDALENLGSRHLAIANPVTAPYGAAAKSFLQNAGLWDRLAPNIVYGQNIAQTLQFVATLNASLGFVAAPQAQSNKVPESTCRWSVPPEMHEPIAQQAILMASAADNSAATDFMAFLGSGKARAIIRSHGYEVPD